MQRARSPLLRHTFVLQQFKFYNNLIGLQLLPSSDVIDFFNFLIKLSFSEGYGR